MNIRHHIKKTPEFQPNIPLLDKEFDSNFLEIDDFILSLVCHNDVDANNS